MNMMLSVYNLISPPHAFDEIGLNVFCFIDEEHEASRCQVICSESHWNQVELSLELFHWSYHMTI
jgi:hypothetical protein